MNFEGASVEGRSQLSPIVPAGQMLRNVAFSLFFAFFAPLR
jgi:hypothetical protein